MKTFEEQKKLFVDLCKEKNACELEFKKLLNASDVDQLWTVLLNNSEWCVERGIFKSNAIYIPEGFGGSLYLSFCDLKGITLPTSVGGYLDLRGCDLKGITLPKELNDKVIK